MTYWGIMIEPAHFKLRHKLLATYLLKTCTHLNDFLGKYPTYIISYTPVSYCIIVARQIKNLELRTASQSILVEGGILYRKSSLSTISFWTSPIVVSHWWAESESYSYIPSKLHPFPLPGPCKERIAGPNAMHAIVQEQKRSKVSQK